MPEPIRSLRLRAALSRWQAPDNASAAILREARMHLIDAIGIALAADRLERDEGHAVAAVVSESWIGENCRLKPYPSVAVTHGFIEAAYMLREETSLHDDEVAAITCPVSARTFAAACEPMIEKRNPATTAQAMTSLPYCVAAALVLNKINPQAFAPESRANPRIVALMKKISCVVDPQVPEDQSESRLTVKRTRGSDVECLVTTNLGTANHPMSADQIHDKFRDNLAFAGFGAQAGPIIDAVERLKANADIQSLNELLGKLSA